MVTDTYSGAEPGIGSLVGGIITDAQDLMKQQLALFRKEIQVELRQAKNAAISLSIGVGVAAVGGGLLLLAIVHLLNYATAIPLWGCYGIVGGTLFAVGMVLFLLGKQEASDVELVPPPQTAQSMKENWQWLKGQTISSRT